VERDDDRRPGDSPPGDREPPQAGAAAGAEEETAAEPARSGLLYCGLCGALNPASNHFCAACGTTLVDAFHGTEGLRIYQRPDAAARLVAIVPAGRELDLLPDAGAPADFARVRLEDGRIGYVRLPEVESLAAAPAARSAPRRPDINTNARGCVSSGAALAALALLLVTGTLGLVLLVRTDVAGSGILTLVFCLVVAPVLLLTIGLYLYARNREDRLEEEEEEQAASLGPHATT
jgi:hypothetical protein